MDFLADIYRYVIVFLVLLTVLVFVHEMGHYMIARWAGVHVTVFSVGFGPAILQRQDRHGTTWRLGLFPVGGYIRMRDGAANNAEMQAAPAGAFASGGPGKAFDQVPAPARAAIVTAGPLANFVLAIVALTLLFMTFGQPFSPPRIDDVALDGAGYRGGMRVGDWVTHVNGSPVERFEDVQEKIRRNPSVPLEFQLRRGNREIRVTATPTLARFEDSFGNVYRIGYLGIANEEKVLVQHDPLTALWRGTVVCFRLAQGTLTAIWEMAIGIRSLDEIAGPLRIAKITGDVLEREPALLLWMTAFLSINLCLINLFPVPGLDGGHLVYCAIEAARGHPPGERAQRIGVRAGLGFVVGLMVLATWNDLVHADIIGLIGGLLG